MHILLGLQRIIDSRTPLAAFGAITLSVAICVPGCDSSAKTGALGGAGIGALAGGLIGGGTQSALIGAAVGTGVGYMIGNEEDKKRADEMHSSQSYSAPAEHAEVGKLGGTRWNLVSLAPASAAKPYVSKVVRFKRNGRVITTTTQPDGKLDVTDESYRVVGDTLIINKPGYLINARFSKSGGQLIVSAEDFRAVLERL